MEHDPRCEGPDDEKLLADVKEYGWHVIEIFETDEMPGWAFSIGLYKNFNHPEIVVFGLDDSLMHSVINSIGEDVRAGTSFAIDGLYRDLIEAYSCTFKPVNPVWYHHFLGYAIGSIKGRIIQRCNAFGRTRTADSHGILSSILIVCGRNRCYSMTSQLPPELRSC